MMDTLMCGACKDNTVKGEIIMDCSPHADLVKEPIRAYEIIFSGHYFSADNKYKFFSMNTEISNHIQGMFAKLFQDPHDDESKTPAVNTFSRALDTIFEQYSCLQKYWLSLFTSNNIENDIRIKQKQFGLAPVFNYSQSVSNKNLVPTKKIYEYPQFAQVMKKLEDCVNELELKSDAPVGFPNVKKNGFYYMHLKCKTGNHIPQEILDANNNTYVTKKFVHHDPTEPDIYYMGQAVMVDEKGLVPSGVGVMFSREIMPSKSIGWKMTLGLFNGKFSPSMFCYQMYTDGSFFMGTSINNEKKEGTYFRVAPLRKNCPSALEMNFTDCSYLYMGEFNNDLPSDVEGTFYFIRKQLIRYNDDQLSDNGVNLACYCKKYTGGCKDGQPEGKGYIVCDSDRWFKGSFENGKPTGTGKFFDGQKAIQVNIKLDGRIFN